MYQYILKFLFILDEKNFKIILLAFLFIFSSILEVLGVGAAGFFVKYLFDPLPSELELFNFKLEINNKLMFIFFILLLFIFKNILAYLIKVWINVYGINKQKDLRIKVFKKYLGLPFSNLVSRSNGDILNLILNYTTNFATSILTSILNLISEFLTILCISIYLLYVAPIPFLLGASFFIFTIILYDYFFKSKISYHGKIINEKSANIIAEVSSILKGIREIKILRKELFFIKKFSIHINQIRNSMLVDNYIKLIPRYFYETLLIILLFILYYFYTYVGNINDFMFVVGAFGAASLRILPSATQISRNINIIRSSMIVVDKLYSELKNNQKHKYFETDNESKNNYLPKFEIIDIQNLSFKYQNSKYPLFENVNLQIKKGEIIGIYGKSGTGKTTFVNLVLGLLKPISGDICVKYQNKNYPISNISKAYIPQDPFILNDSYLNNIALGELDNEIDLEKVNSSIKKAIIDFINVKENGLNNLINEETISGGQKQRLSLARAFYFSKDLIILDEVSSSLDNINEEMIKKSISQLKSNHTVIIISHNIEFLNICDKIYKISDNKINKI